jgi:predicted neuraminidase
MPITNHILNCTGWLAFLLIIASPLEAAEPFFHTELIFPLQAKHVHSSCIVECPNGDLLTTWFHGSGERESPDVVIQGSRLRRGATAWSEVFLMADTPYLPDCNPVLFIDANHELTLFWIAVLGDSWNYCLPRFRKSRDYNGDGPPKWHWQDDLILTPGKEFVEALEKGLSQLSIATVDYGGHATNPAEALIDAAKDPGKRQLGWMPRTHLLTLPSGRILLPLYSDAFYVGLMAISDDGGRSWHPSRPIVGVGLNQPSVVRKRDGTLVAYLRREGPPPPRVQISTSRDDGETWSLAEASDIPNPNTSLEVISLRDGRWVMVYNDIEEGRDRLALAVSADEGQTWNHRRHLEATPGGLFHYPSIIQTRDGNLHLTYTYQPGDERLRAIKHVAFDADWISSGPQ